MDGNLLIGKWFSHYGMKVQVLDIWTDRGSVQSQYGGWSTWVNRMVTVKSEHGNIVNVEVDKLKTITTEDSSKIEDICLQ